MAKRQVCNISIQNTPVNYPIEFDDAAGFVTGGRRTSSVDIAQTIDAIKVLDWLTTGLNRIRLYTGSRGCCLGSYTHLWAGSELRTESELTAGKYLKWFKPLAEYHQSIPEDARYKPLLRAECADTGVVVGKFKTRFGLDPVSRVMTRACTALGLAHYLDFCQWLHGDDHISLLGSKQVWASHSQYLSMLDLVEDLKQQPKPTEIGYLNVCLAMWLRARQMFGDWHPRRVLELALAVFSFFNSSASLIWEKTGVKLIETNTWLVETMTLGSSVSELIARLDDSRYRFGPGRCQELSLEIDRLITGLCRGDNSVLIHMTIGLNHGNIQDNYYHGYGFGENCDHYYCSLVHTDDIDLGRYPDKAEAYYQGFIRQAVVNHLIEGQRLGQENIKWLWPEGKQRWQQGIMA